MTYNKQIMESILLRDDVIECMVVFMDKELDLIRLCGTIKLLALARGVTHRLPVGVITTPNFNFKDMVTKLINGNMGIPDTELDYLNTKLANSECTRKKSNTWL